MTNKCNISLSVVAAHIALSVDTRIVQRVQMLEEDRRAGLDKESGRTQEKEKGRKAASLHKLQQ